MSERGSEKRESKRKSDACDLVICMGRHGVFVTGGLFSCRCYAYRALSAPMKPVSPTPKASACAVMAGRGCVARATSQHGPSCCSAGTELC